MNNTTQHAVIIDNISSPYIDRAIIILREFSPDIQSKVIEDAEKVVRDYLKKIKTDDSDITIYKHAPNKNIQNKHRISLFGKIILTSLLIGLSVLVVKLFVNF